jgi:hypothetical protein
MDGFLIMRIQVSNIAGLLSNLSLLSLSIEQRGSVLSSCHIG